MTSFRDRVIQALNTEKPSLFFRECLQSGELEKHFPDLHRGVDCTQNEYHDFDTVFDHLLRCLDYSVTLTDDIYLRLAVLCHDIAKPHTKSVGADGRVHFYRHEIVGASIVYKWMHGLKFPPKKIEYVTKLVRYHQWRFEENSKEKTIRRWMQSVGKDVWKDLIILRCADRRGNLKKGDLPGVTKEMKDLLEKANKLIEEGKVVFKEDLALTSQDLRTLGVPPEKYKQVISNMLGIVLNDASRNTRSYLTDYVQRNY